MSAPLNAAGQWRDIVPLQRAMAFLACLFMIAALLALGREIFVPLALAMLLSFALAPVSALLERAGLPRSLSVTLTIFAFLALVGFIAYIVFVQASDLAAQLPGYRSTIRAKLHELTSSMSGNSPFTRAIDLFGELSKEFGQADPAQKGALVVAMQDQSGLSTFKTAGSLSHGVAVFAAVMLITAFTLLQREDLRNRIISLMGSTDIQQTTAVLDDAGSRLGRLLLAQLTVNIFFAALVGGFLWLIGLPSPFLWGALAAVLRYIPYIGAFLGLAPPLLIAFAVDPTWTSFLWTAAFFVVIEFFVAHILEPLVYGKSTGLSPFAVVLAVLVWSFLWGIVGLVLAIPLTICLVVLGRHVERLSFLATLLGDRPALQPHDIFYQRLLAGDARGAVRNAKGVVRGTLLAPYFDLVILPGLRRAHADIVRGALDEQRTERVSATGRQAMRLVGERAARPKLQSRLTPEAAALREALAPLAPARAEAAGAMPQTGARVIVMSGRHPLDALPAMMLRHALRPHRFDVRMLEAPEQGTCGMADAEADCVLLSFMEPQRLALVRASCTAARKAAPRALIVLAVWQELTESARSQLEASARADVLALSMQEALLALTPLETPLVAGAASDAASSQPDRRASLRAHPLSA